MQAAPVLTRRAALVAADAIVLPRRTAARRPPDGNAEYGVLRPELHTIYAGQVDPALCFVSEKYDGVRALWDGSTLRHRSGRSLAAPAWFLAALPRAARRRALARPRTLRAARCARSSPRAGDADWQAVRYMVFDTPIAGPSFAVRLENLAAMASQLGAPIEIAPQWHVADRAELERALAVLPRGALQAEAAP